MVEPARRRHRGVTRLAAGTVLVALVAAGCSADPTTGAAPAPSSAPTGTASTAAACVADVATVIATPATPESLTNDLPADQVAELDRAARAAFAQAAAPGAIVGVRTPAGTWTAAYGTADPATKAPMAVGMHTRIGSVTKTYTGTVIMRLAQDGRLSLDDPIETYVPGVPNGDRVTLRQLADMTSGVASYTANTAFTDVYFAKPETVFTPDQLLEIGIEASPLFEPGEQFNYSNTNTILLGLVIEKVTGQTVAEVMQELVLGPLQLTATSWPGESPDLPSPYAQGFTLQGDAATPDAPSNATHWNPAWGWTAGEMIADLDDLLVYGRALGTGQGLLDPATQTERLTSFPAPGGYGLGMGCVDGWVGHTGELPGYNTTLYYDTTADTTVVVQTNSDIASGDCPESPTLTDDSREQECSSPATRIFVALSTALGNTVHPPGRR